MALAANRKFWVSDDRTLFMEAISWRVMFTTKRQQPAFIGLIREEGEY
jgi:hypothetical protein